MLGTDLLDHGLMEVWIEVGAERLNRRHTVPPQQVVQLPVDQLHAFAVRRAALAGVDGERTIEIVDDFDRALTVDAGEGSAAYRKGVELIHGKLHDLLRRYGVTPIEALGTDFDPNIHQAVMHEVSPEHREGEVLGELQRGYLIGDKLLRPAMVKVAKA